MFANMRTELTNNIMLIQWCKDYKARDGRTWVCFRKAWNPISRSGHKSILHNIMQGRLFPTMNASKKVDPHRIQKQATNAVWHSKD
jgi:hypothetical protein